MLSRFGRLPPSFLVFCSPQKHHRCSLQNYQEVGGGDVAVLVGLGNTLANIPASPGSPTPRKAEAQQKIKQIS